MKSFLQGMLAGYGIAIPVGAISILIIETGLRRGFRHGFAAGTGAASADLIYAFLAALAGGAFAQILSPFSQPLRFLSGLVLILIGGLGLWKQIRTGKATQSAIIDKTLIKDSGSVQTYLRFLWLTLLNPMTIAYFGAIIVGGAADLDLWTARGLFVTGAAISSLSWQTFIAGVGTLGHRHFSPEIQRTVSLIGNGIVIILGLRMLL